MGGPSPRRGGWEFVGRDHEIAELVAGLEDALGGRGRLFLIAGEPGIGKTRLAEQLAGHAAERGTGVAWGRCWEGGGAPPYWPWAQIIRTVAEGRDDRTLSSWLGTGATYVAQLAPDLAPCLGTAATASGPPIESDAARFYLFEAAAGFLKRAAAAQPLLLILEDLHAADDSSLLLLRYLVRDLRGGRLLVVGTYRDVGWSPGIADSVGELVREGQLTTLRGLARDDAKALISALLGAAPPDGLVAAVYDTTEGNPLFIREAVRLLGSAGTVEQPGRPGVPLPGSVRVLIRQRLAPLSADAAQVLSAAAVVGRDFDLALVGPACDLPLERVLGAVAEAVALGLVVEESGALGRCRFSHSLMREVIYEALPLPARAGLHLAVGEAIERRYGTDSDTHVAELARHFSEVASAGESARALTYARRAGDRAMQTYAYEEAVTEYRRALRALEIAGPDEDQRCELLLRLGAAQVRAGRYPEAREIHLQAAEIARRLGSTERLARAALGFGEPQVEGGQVNHRLVGLLREALSAWSDQDAPLRARVLARLSVELTFSEEVHLTDSLSRQAVEMARRLGDAGSLGDALGARWMAVWGPDGLGERSAVAAEILQLVQQTGDRDLEFRGRALRAATALELGDFLAAEAEIAAHARLADELRMPVHQWAASTMQAMRALLQGSLEEAERLAEAAFSVQPERPNARWAYLTEVSFARWERGRLGELRETWQTFVDRFPRLAAARAWLALADIERGDREAAHRALQLLAELIPVQPRSGLWPLGIALASLVCAQLDDPDASGRLYPLLLSYGGQVFTMNMEQPVACFGSAALYLGLLASAASRWAEAGDHFEVAIRMHERLGAIPLLTRTRYEYARLLIRHGLPAGRGQALELLQSAAATARATGMAALGAQITRLLAADADETPPEMPPVTLSGERDTPAVGLHSEPKRDRFRREGEYWSVFYDGKVIRLKDSKGLRQIALLLAQPGREVQAMDLEAMVGGPAEPTASGSGRRVGPGELERRPDFGHAGELLDAQARAAYKARLTELEEELDEAERFNDPVRAERAREERDVLVRELARAVGLGGRDRRAASHAERARLNATRAIRAALANLAREHPALGRHLAATIRTGRYCAYTPDPRAPVTWEL